MLIEGFDDNVEETPVTTLSIDTPSSSSILGN